MRSVIGAGLGAFTVVTIAVSVACVGDEPASGLPTSDGGRTVTSDCTKNEDCVALATEPAGCATSTCDLGTKKCVYAARDADGDGHATRCTSLEPTVSVTTGDDCDDANPAFFPGATRACSAMADGTAVEFPGGSPRGLCKAGTQLCNADGTIGSCTGVVAPKKEDCSTADIDEDCDGSPVNDCPCEPIGATQACGAHPGKDGVGACQAGSQVCGAQGWGACTGAVDPAADTCLPDSDDLDCDGIRGNGAGCTRTVYQYAKGGTVCTGPTPTEFYLSNAEDTSVPNQFTLVASFKLFEKGSGAMTAIHRCRNTVDGFWFVGYGGCGGGAVSERIVGHATSLPVGNGWVGLAEVFGSTGSTGILPLTACTCCTAGSYKTLK